jgi:hypothetical protein
MVYRASTTVLKQPTRTDDPAEMVSVPSRINKSNNHKENFASHNTVRTFIRK